MELSPRLIRQVNEHELVVPKVSRLTPAKRRAAKQAAAAMVAAEWPAHLAKLQAADAKRARRRARNLGLG